MVAAYTAADKFDAIIAIDAPTARSESLSPSHKIVFSDLAESGEGVKRGQFWREIRLRRRSVQSCSHLARVHFMDTSPDRHQSVMPLCKEFPQHGYIEEVKFPGHRDGAETLAWLQAVRRDCPRFGRGRRAKSQAF